MCLRETRLRGRLRESYGLVECGWQRLKWTVKFVPFVFGLRQGHSSALTSVFDGFLSRASHLNRDCRKGPSKPTNVALGPRTSVTD